MLDRVKIQGEKKPILKKGDSLLKEPNYNLASSINRYIVLHELVSTVQIFKDWLYLCF
jgi:hypothetical protein